MNPWQRKAQERWPNGAYKVDGLWRRAGHWAEVTDESDILLHLPTILEHLAYERQECERCDGSGLTDDMTATQDDGTCPTCHGTGLDPDYRKAQEWAERLGLEDG